MQPRGEVQFLGLAPRRSEADQPTRRLGRSHISSTDRRHVVPGRAVAGTSRSPAASGRVHIPTPRRRPSLAQRRSSVGQVAARSGSMVETAPSETPTPSPRATTRTRPATSGRPVMRHARVRLGTAAEGRDRRRHSRQAGQRPTHDVVGPSGIQVREAIRACPTSPRPSAPSTRPSPIPSGHALAESSRSASRWTWLSTASLQSRAQVLSGMAPNTVTQSARVGPVCAGPRTRRSPGRHECLRRGNCRSRQPLDP